MNTSRNAHGVISEPSRNDHIGKGREGKGSGKGRSELALTTPQQSVTRDPWHNKTWCLCGDVIRDGNHFTHAACCGGPLDRGAAAPAEPEEAPR